MATATEQYLAKAKELITKKDYRKAILTLQKARDACKCNAAFQQLGEKETKPHSTTKNCLLYSILEASISDDPNAIYRVATGACSCGTKKLSCDREAHVEVLDKLSVCSEALPRANAAMAFAAAAIDLSPTSPIGYCRLSKLLRPGSKAYDPMLEGHDNESLALGVVSQGIHNIKTHGGSVRHPLFKVLQVIYKKLARSDPFEWLPTELKALVCSYLDTIDLLRCMRVSKRWLVAIRDEPDLWKHIYLPLRPHSKKSRVKGLSRLLEWAPKMQTLAFSGLSLEFPHYKQVLRKLTELRHLHIEDGLKDCSFSADEILKAWGLRSNLTRLTYHVEKPGAESNILFRYLLGTCSTTLHELQFAFPYTFTNVFLDWVPYLMPQLKILRVTCTGTQPSGNTANMSHLIASTPNLEQFCIAGKTTLSWPDAPTTKWERLKVLTVGPNVRIQGRLAACLPSGIRVIDITSTCRTPNQDTFYSDDCMLNADDWPKLEFFRCEQRISDENLRRMVGPSLKSGTLKTLHLGSCSDTNWWPPDLNFKSEHIHVIGLDDIGDAFETGEQIFALPISGYLKWLENFPNAHTFSVSPGLGVSNLALVKALTERAHTRRIFLQTGMLGVEWDEAKAVGDARGVALYNNDFPCYFPWHLDDNDGPGTEPGEVKDVVDQWKLNRGRLEGDLTSVVHQPFFRE